MQSVECEGEEEAEQGGRETGQGQRENPESQTGPGGEEGIHQKGIQGKGPLTISILSSSSRRRPPRHRDGHFF